MIYFLFLHYFQKSLLFFMNCKTYIWLFIQHVTMLLLCIFLLNSYVRNRIYLLTCLLVYLLACFLIDRPTDWRTDWLTDWLTDWMNEWMTDWLNEWINEWMNELSRYSINSGFLGDWYNMTTKISFYLGKKISIKWFQCHGKNLAFDWKIRIL